MKRRVRRHIGALCVAALSTTPMLVSSELTQRGVPAKPAAGPRAQPVPCNAPKERLKKGLKEGAAGLAVRTIKRGRSQESPDGRRYMVAYIDCLSSEGTPLYRGERPASFVFLEYQHLYAGRALQWNRVRLLAQQGRPDYAGS